MEQKTTFHKTLFQKVDNFAHDIYRETKSFPKSEIFGMTSQIRRASLSVVLNYVEGYARGSSPAYKQFLKISYGSLKESLYLIDFAQKEGYIDIVKAEKLTILGNEIGKMLWSVMSRL